MELLNSLSDDQTAMVGCVAVLLGCAVLLTLGHWIGSKVRGEEKSHTIKLSENYRQRSEESHAADKAA